MTKFKLFLAIIVAFSIIQISNAQEYDDSKINEKYNELNKMQDSLKKIANAFESMFDVYPSEQLHI